MINAEQYLDFIIKTELTQSQFMLLYLIYYCKINSKKAYELIEKYRRAFPSEDGTLIGKYLTDDLIKRKFLIKNSNSDGNKITDFDVSGRFTEAFVDRYSAGNAVWDAYPTFLVSKSQNFPLTAMDKNVFRDLYWKAINGSRVEHMEILKDIEYAKEKNLIKMKIENFVKSEGWEGLRKERLGTGIIMSVASVDENEFNV